ncbi:HMP-PP hydrolase (pyridoxal phosphatase) Cof, detected in genetic screen for thiamin metabolic genes (PMID:15292217) [[Actinomadura] parvosata subsp. kistnae]|uniref:Alpha/beta hydrolase n=1 Tax=[Actinomadura] parvosata subsp. kistnae TaxID=1909395 RepID=A0A1U9ZXY7_9ACTN|nr:alpha/beta hydrolase [Nonomuraea sp. ATCC 55076]AQZ62826.1 alpha/beta hydrolase [Nonomuraea sp. ATCC 55076]SPL98359.1 HMP-PP hydrolase (pyridoxal phosphatase) Cof, detected in genetic screen for thiamin metabolic genes (PMID:15292217) [Actinomadura parvosata subsp. kistnae]
MTTTGVARVGGIRLHYTRAGSGPLLVLLHGWPQTGLCWEPVLAPLAAGHTVVAPDLRGYGLSDKPATGYDKRRMAADIAELVTSLGFDRASVVGHDRGARVAHRWALDRPDQVERLAVLDVVPTREMFRRLDASVASSYWHWLFHLQPDLPERLVGHDVRGYLEFFFERWTYNRHGLSPEAVDAYVRAFSRPGALRAGFDDYRAHELDLALDDEDAAAGRRLTMPVLALWGSAGLPARLPTLEIWREYAEDVRGAEIPECGHFIPEERPDALLAHLRDFLPGGAAIGAITAL